MAQTDQVRAVRSRAIHLRPTGPTGSPTSPPDRRRAPAAPRVHHARGVGPSRRRFLAGAGAAGLAALAGCGDGGDAAPPTSVRTTAPPAPPSTLPALDHGPPTGAFPFAQGVASGDPDHTSVLLWSRVDRPVGEGSLVEVAADPELAAVVARVPVAFDPDADGTTRVVVDGLTPDRAWWYRFVADGHTSPIGRTRTAPAPGVAPAEPLRIGHVSCQRWSSGWWTALDDLAEQAPDLVVHCGDFVYESDAEGVRTIDAPEATDLEGYRLRYRTYRTDPALQAAQATGPWLQVWDDHEVVNDVAALPPDAGPAAVARRAAAHRAWWEHTPTRLPPPEGAALRIHRTVDWGALTRFVLLDGRQHRDRQPCDPAPGFPGQVGPRCEEADDLSMLGAEQEAWVADVAVGHGATWTTVVNQTVLHQWRLAPGNVAWNLDQWDGYPAARARLLEVLARAPAPVVLTGDVHSSWVADLRADFDDDGLAPIGAELVAPGVSSAPPAVLRSASTLIERLSPHVAWSETTRRGWVLHTVTPDAWVSEHRLVETVAEPGAPVEVAATWRLDPTRPGLGR